MDREFLQIAKELPSTDVAAARATIMGVYDALERLAEAAKPIVAACPACKAAGGKGRYEAVNEFSGVWSRPECPTCRELSQLIAAVDALATKLRMPGTQ